MRHTTVEYREANDLASPSAEQRNSFKAYMIKTNLFTNTKNYHSFHHHQKVLNLEYLYLHVAISTHYLQRDVMCYAYILSGHIKNKLNYKRLNRYSYLAEYFRHRSIIFRH